MAEFILKSMVREAGLADEFKIESAATSREEIGNDVYPPAKAEMRERGIPFESRAARQITAEEYDDYDMFLCMDDNNVRNINCIFGGDPEGKVRKLLVGLNVSDPWYTGDFGTAFDDIYEGCKRLLE